MKWGGDRQHHRTLGTPGFRDLDRALDRCLVAGNHDLTAAVVIGCLADLPPGGFVRHCDDRLEFEPKQRRHGTGAYRHGFLHCLPAQSH